MKIINQGQYYEVYGLFKLLQDTVVMRDKFREMFLESLNIDKNDDKNINMIYNATEDRKHNLDVLLRNMGFELEKKDDQQITSTEI